MTYTPRRIIDAMADELHVEPAPAVFDPCSGVHPDFEAARVRQRLREAEQLNSAQETTPAPRDYSVYRATQEAVTYGAGPAPWWVRAIASMEYVSWWILPVFMSGLAAWGWGIFHIGKAMGWWG